MKNRGSEKTKPGVASGGAELSNGVPSLLIAFGWLNAPHKGVLVSSLS